MSFDPAALDGAICVTVDIVPGGNERRRENIAALRITTIPEPTSGYLVEGFETESALGGYAQRSCRIGAQDRRQSIWTLLANAAYGLNGAKSDED